MGLWEQIEALVARGQQVYHMLKYAPFPSVGAPSGMALGGGCEILLHCTAVQAHAETYTGLVEAGVGIVPAWGGCKEMLLRHWQTASARAGRCRRSLQAFETLSLAKVSSSAADAKRLLYLRPEDGITMNRDRLLADAKAKALALADGYRPPLPPTDLAPARPDREGSARACRPCLRPAGKATAHDQVVAGALAEVISGGAADITVPLAEDDLLTLERRSFMRLIRHPASIARIEHLLETGKPLRN